MRITSGTIAIISGAWLSSTPKSIYRNTVQAPTSGRHVSTARQFGEMYLMRVNVSDLNNHSLNSLQTHSHTGAFFTNVNNVGMILDR